MHEYDRSKQTYEGKSRASETKISPILRGKPDKAFLVAMSFVGGLLTLFVLWVGYTIWFSG